jgi:hypothetical protein
MTQATSRRSAEQPRPPGAGKGKPTPTRAASRGTGRKPDDGAKLFRLPDGSRSVQSPWVWRGFAFLSLIAFGLFLSFVTSGHHLFLAVAWALITVGWFSIAMWLWRKHVKDDDAWYARQRGRRAV